MRIPSFDRLKHCPSGEIQSYARRMHPNPRYYKYLWWVFWQSSPCEGEAFLAEANSLCTGLALALRERLDLAGESYWLYNKSLPRDEPGVTPFDRNAPRWKDVTFATALDQDPDPDWQGFR
jgi:hypothetical protein